MSMRSPTTNRHPAASAGAPVSLILLAGCMAAASPSAPPATPATAPAQATPAAKPGDSKPNAGEAKAALANKVTVTEQDGVRTIVSNGIPDHQPGKFPNRGNPNTLSEQRHTFRMTMAPKLTDTVTPHRMRWAAVAVNGVPFEPGTAEAWKNDPSTGWRIEAIQPARGGTLGIDASNGHVQPTGAYHYHGLPTGMVTRLAEAKHVKVGDEMILVGWAADGFPMYDFHGYAKADDAKSGMKELHSSWRLKKGERPGGDKGPGGSFDGTYTQDYEFVKGSGDLDECNGRTGVTPEFPKGTYYYVITGEFPYVTRALRGTPDKSFTKNEGGPRGGPGGGRPGGRPGGPPGGQRGRGPGGPGGPGGPAGPGGPPPEGPGGPPPEGPGGPPPEGMDRS